MAFELNEFKLKWQGPWRDRTFYQRMILLCGKENLIDV